jgi:hypothetical protein
VGAGFPSEVFASLRHEPCGFSSLPTSTLLRWERDFLRRSSLRYGTNPAVSHPFQPPRYCGGSGISFGGLRFATARTLRFLIPSNLHVIAVGAGFPSEVFASLRHEPCGFSSLPTSTLLRWERDSNPRYSYPYDSLANCWFQPLTHPTVVNGRQK